MIIFSVCLFFQVLFNSILLSLHFAYSDPHTLTSVLPLLSFPSSSLLILPYSSPLSSLPISFLPPPSVLLPSLVPLLLHPYSSTLLCPSSPLSSLSSFSFLLPILPSIHPYPFSPLLSHIPPFSPFLHPFSPPLLLPFHRSR